MRKITLVMALLLSLVVVKAQRVITFENVDYCIGAIFNKVSNNGKYVAGYAEASLNGSNVGFVYLVESGEMVVLNPEWEEYPEQSHLVSAAANDVSNDGIVAGHYCFDDTYRRPAIYNLSTGLWTKLELPSSVDGKITEAGSKYGEATSISSDGKYISGYVKSRMDNSEGIKIVPRDVPCVWVRVNDDVLNPEYKLQMPIDTDHTKISCNGDWTWHMSDDAKWMGGNSSAKSGSFNVTIWENHFNDSLLDRQIIIGKDDWDRSVDDNGDGVIDDEDGADEGQYDWNGIVSCISPNGEWVVGYHTFNGTGYGQANQSAVGFRYNTKTKVLEDSLMAGCPTVVFDDGEMIFDRTGVMSSSDDKSVQCGTAVIATDLGNLNVPMLILMDETAVENVEDLGVNIFVNNSILTIEGEYTSVEVYSVSGAMIALFDGTMNEINLSNLAKGVYLVRVINENQAITRKITL